MGGLRPGTQRHGYKSTPRDNEQREWVSQRPRSWNPARYGCSAPQSSSFMLCGSTSTSSRESSLSGERLPLSRCRRTQICRCRGARGYRGILSTGSMFSDLIPWDIPYLFPGRNRKWQKKYSGNALASRLSFVADIFMKSFSSLEISLWTSVFEIHPQSPHEPTIVTGSIVAGL